MRRISLAVLGLVSGLVCGGPAVAEQEPGAPDPNDPNAVAAEAVGDPGYYATATVYARPLASATAAVSVIERQDIAAAGAGNVGDLLRQIPGVQIIGSGTRGGLATVQIRGGDPNFTLVLLDGVPINDSTDTLGGAVNLETLPVDGIERIEIVRGPLSHYYGSAALAGAINIVTHSGAAARQVRTSVEGGTASLFRASASVEGALGAGRQFWLASWEQQQHQIAEEQFDQFRLDGNVQLPLRREGLARLSAHVSAETIEDYPEGSGGPVLGSQELRHADLRELTLGAETLLGKSEPGQHKLVFTLFGRQLDRISPGVEPFVPPSIEETRYWRGRLGWAKAVYSRHGLQLTAGADLSWEHGQSDILLRLPPELGGDLSGSYARNRTIPGAYAELLLERGALLVEAASRLDVPVDSAAQWSPRVGASYRVAGDRTRLHASAGSAFKLPSFTALANPRELGGNPDLEPERAFGADLGLDQELRKLGLRANLSVFYQHFHNLIDFDFDTFQNVNRSSVDTHGAELAFDWRLPANFTLDTGLTWMRSEDKTSGTELLHRPEWTGSFRLRWSQAQRLSLALDGQAVSRAGDRQLVVSDRDSVEGHWFLGATSAWTFAERWTLQLRVENLTDTEYEALIGFPGAGRSVKLRLQVHWL